MDLFNLFVMFFVFCYFAMLYPGSGVVLDFNCDLICAVFLTLYNILVHLTSMVESAKKRLL